MVKRTNVCQPYGTSLSIRLGYITRTALTHYSVKRELTATCFKFVRNVRSFVSIAMILDHEEKLKTNAGLDKEFYDAVFSSYAVKN